MPQQCMQRENFIGNTIYIHHRRLHRGRSSNRRLIRSHHSSETSKKLNKTAEDISQGNMNVTVNVNRKDEIGDLAESFSRMVASLKFMMSENQPPSKPTNNEANHRDGII